MNKQTFFKLLIAIILIVLLGTAIFSQNNDEEGSIKIGYIGPLTGPSAVLGMDAVKAVEIAVKEANDAGGVNGRQIELFVEDDQYLTKNTVSAYNKLVHTNDVKILLVASYGGLFAVKDLAVQDGVIIINPLDCNKEVADAQKNIFCVATETESIGEVLANQMIKEGKTRAGIMYSTKDTFMALVADAFTETFEANGGKVQVESFNYDDEDFRTQLMKMKGTEGLVLLGHDETGTIMKQARTLGMKQAFYTTGTITSPVAQELAVGNTEGTVLALWDANSENQKAKTFNEKFVKLVGRNPIFTLTTHPAYDAVKILTDRVLPEVESINAKELKTELLKVSGYQGVTGTVNIDSSGGAPIKESAYRLIKGIPVKI